MRRSDHTAQTLMSLYPLHVTPIIRHTADEEHLHTRMPIAGTRASLLLAYLQAYCWHGLAFSRRLSVEFATQLAPSALGAGSSGQLTLHSRHGLAFSRKLCWGNSPLDQHLLLGGWSRRAVDYSLPQFIDTDDSSRLTIHRD